jgi:anti-sigma factor RsiW
MDRERFEQLVEAYGADPARWPADLRAAAEAAAASPEAGEALRAARALDQALDSFDSEPPSLALRQRILARAPRPRSAPAWRLGRAFWLSGAGLAAACAVGVVVGVSLGGAMATSASQADRDTEAAAAFGTVTAFGAPVEASRAG